MKDALLAVMIQARNQTLKLVADLNDDQMVAQPAPKTNHAAWVLGHLLMVDYAFLKLVNNGEGPTADAAFIETYGNKSTPVADKSKYHPKQYYIDNLATTRAKILDRIKAMKPEDFDQPHPDPARRDRFPTIGHTIMFYGTWHETYHSGQLSAWRRVQGLPAV